MTTPDAHECSGPMTPSPVPADNPGGGIRELPAPFLSQAPGPRRHFPRIRRGPGLLLSKDPEALPMSTNSVSRGADDFRAASGLGRWPLSPADLEADGNSAPLRGPGLFEVVRGSGERMITNVRRIAGADRAPGSRLVLAATVLLGLLAAGLFVVTLNAQYKYVYAAKAQSVPSMIEAASLDLGMAIFTLLALGLAMA